MLLPAAPAPTIAPPKPKLLLLLLPITVTDTDPVVAVLLTTWALTCGTRSIVIERVKVELNPTVRDTVRTRSVDSNRETRAPPGDPIPDAGLIATKESEIQTEPPHDVPPSRTSGEGERVAPGIATQDGNRQTAGGSRVGADRHGHFRVMVSC